ncbi:glycoside hydrolase family 172 protein [Lacticaseibacillus mingshuiensis]|uniref:Glycoside hydrolase family 172 protein n=1 Tax=Lacticaseibacillus mingshuiensis TaxID=2799574 RepID=A0ABW4CH10_9LACO|nr:glycoside hydrolase family 172 protein [Lacticaseibacillus mingshuiensis]
MSLLTDASRWHEARSRSISAENSTGTPGGGGRATTGTGASAARELGVGWKVSPSVMVEPGATQLVGAITGPGVIRHIWLTCPPEVWRETVLQFFWDDATVPAVNVPLGDFFCEGWGQRCNVNSMPIAVNPAGGMNCYWAMPFRKNARIQLINLGDREFPLYYQVDYTLEEVPADTLYFHATWRRSDPLPAKTVHELVPQISGRGQYVGTYLAYESHSTGWWGEGEMKFYLDEDREFPTICGTGTEDYFGGAWNFEQPAGEYGRYSTPFLGLPQVIKPDGLYQSQPRFGLYRWHLADAIRFTTGLRVTLQSLGWRSGGRYLAQQDDLATTAFLYLETPGCDVLAQELTGDQLEIL